MKINLLDTELFRGFDEEETRILLQSLEADEKNYKKGQVILREGEPTNRIGIVLSGMAVVMYSDMWGNNSILGNSPPGAVFAEVYACIPGRPLPVSVYAAAETDILFLNVRKMMTCDTADSFNMKFIRNLLTVCAGKSLQLSSRILHTSPKSIRGRLLSYFSECARKAGDCSFEIPYSRQQLADYLGVDRSSMCSELSKMQKDGLIRYEKKQFVINKQEAVRQDLFPV